MDIDTLIEAYINAYNSKDVDGMVAVLHENIRFENIVNASDTMTLIGKEAFENQARQVLPIFSERIQRIESLIIQQNRAAAEIDYQATVAIDLPNGWKANQQLHLRGVSIFECKDNKLYRITDYS